jgi:hypothetical protein
MNDRERRQRRLDWARFWIHAELMIGVALTLLTVFLFVAAPGFMGRETQAERIAPLVAIGMAIFGLVAMFWFSRPRVE